MGRKICKILIFLFLLMTMLCQNFVKADEQQSTEQGEITDNTNETIGESMHQEQKSEESEKKTIEESVKAIVVQAGSTYEKDNENGGKETVQDVKVKILQGTKENEKFNVTYALSYDLDNKIVGYKLREGNLLFVNIAEENGEYKVTIQDIIRQNYLIALIVFFFASILVIGGKKGLKAIIGLVITVLAIFFILVVAIFKGYNAILVSIGTCFLIIVATYTVIGGWNKKTFSAALGTLGGVVLAGAIASLTGYLAQLSGAGKEEAIMLSLASKNVVFNFKDLLFAQIIVSSLGACMDVGMSISSSLSELKEKKPEITEKELFKSGMNIGGDMIGTMTNTLILSFIGSSLILVLLYMASSVKFIEVINIEAIATEAVCAIAGSVGIVYTVPITALIYSHINKDKEVYKTKSENVIQGKRSLKI